MRGLILAVFATIAAAAPPGAVDAVRRTPEQVISLTPTAVGLPTQIVLLLTGLTVLPVLLMAATPFLRITLVLHFLRQAIGTQSSPSNPVLIGLAMFLTMVIMQPVLQESYEKGWLPFEQGEVSGEAAWKAGSQPVRKFLLRYVREKDVQMLLEVSHTAPPPKPADLETKILLPAYVLSELKTGFQIGAMLFLPFLVVDLIVASVTLSVGIVQLPPAMISAPFKILLFVLVDGWNLVVSSLIKSFY